MPDTIDALELAGGHRLRIVERGGVLSASPMVADHGGWRRAQAGDGAAEALLDLLASSPSEQRLGRFEVTSWADAAPWSQAVPRGEERVGVDQTNESVIVGRAAVVKWATHLDHGPHPARHRIAALRDAGFTGMPAPWGLVTWHQDDGGEVLVAYVDEYLPGAVDGWTWAVEEFTVAARDGAHHGLLAAAGAVGSLVADLHAAQCGRRRTATDEEAHLWHAEALTLVDAAADLRAGDCAEVLRARRADVVAELGPLAQLAGTPLVEGHGDLHVGQVLRSGDRYAVTDFDGNPVLSAEQRMRPSPAVLDVAGMVQSLTHAAIVAARYTDLDPSALSAANRTARATFLECYTRRLAERGLADLFDPEGLRAFRVQQVLREMLYAAAHLPRWMYVPDAALPAVLAESR